MIECPSVGIHHHTFNGPHAFVEATAPLPDEELAAILNSVPRVVCYRTHTQPDEHRGVSGAAWIADIQRALTPFLAALRAERAARARVADHVPGIVGDGLDQEPDIEWWIVCRCGFDVRSDGAWEDHIRAALAPATGEGAE